MSIMVGNAQKGRDMTPLEIRLAELEKEFDAAFTGEDWNSGPAPDESVREVGGADVREITMDLGTLGGSRPRTV